MKRVIYNILGNSEMHEGIWWCVLGACGQVRVVNGRHANAISGDG